MAPTRSRARGREHARPSSGGVAAEHATKIYTFAIVGIIVIIAFLALTSVGHVIDAATQHFMLYYAGVFALIGLCASVGLGLVATDRMFLNPGHRVFIQSAHRAASFGAVAFLVIHIITEILAQRVHVLDAVIPFLSPFRTFYIGLGTIASDLILLLVITGIMRGRFNAERQSLALAGDSLHVLRVVRLRRVARPARRPPWQALRGLELRVPHRVRPARARGAGVQRLAQAQGEPERAAGQGVGGLGLRPVARRGHVRAARRVAREQLRSRTPSPAASPCCPRPCLPPCPPAAREQRARASRTTSPATRGRQRYLGAPRATGTGPMPRARTGPMPRRPHGSAAGSAPYATGPLPRVPTGPFPRVPTGPLPRCAVMPTGPLPRVPTASAAGCRRTRPVRCRVSLPAPLPRCRRMRRVRCRPYATGPLPPNVSGPMPRVPNRPGTGPRPQFRPATGPMPLMPPTATGPLPQAGGGRLPRLGGGHAVPPAERSNATCRGRPAAPGRRPVRCRRTGLARGRPPGRCRSRAGTRRRSPGGCSASPQPGRVHAARSPAGTCRRSRAGTRRRSRAGTRRRSPGGYMPPQHHSDGGGGWPAGPGWQAAGHDGSRYPAEPPWDDLQQTDPNLRYREPGPGMPGYRGSREHRYGGDAR